jgi:hypothetical protein
VGGLGVALFVIRQRTYCDTGEGARLGDVTHLASTWRMSCFDASLGIGEEGCSHGWIVAQTMPPRRYAIYMALRPPARRVSNMRPQICGCRRVN